MTSKRSDVPRVSVLIPAYNSEAFVADTIASALDQTISDLELIVVDDGSSDATVAVVESAIAGESRARLLTQENRGLSGARNTALRAARSPFVALLDSDDLWRPTKLERQLEVIEADPRLVCVGCFNGYVGESGRRLPRRLDARVRGGEDPASAEHQELIRRALFLPFAPCSMVIRRSALNQIGGSDESLEHCEDVDTLARLATVGRIGFVAETLADYRLRTGSMLGGGYLEARREGMFVALRQRRRLDGSDLTWDEFIREYDLTKSVRRVARSGHQARRAAAALLERRIGAAIASGLAAVVSNPGYFASRIRRSLLARGVKPEGYQQALAPDGQPWLE